MSLATHQSCIDACIECAKACEECFAACLKEPHVAKMSQCLRLDRDCAELCWLTAGFLHRGTRSAIELAGGPGFVYGEGPPLLRLRIRLGVRMRMNNAIPYMAAKAPCVASACVRAR